MLNLRRMLTEWGRKNRKERRDGQGEGEEKRKKYYGGQWLGVRRVRRENSR